MPNNQFPLPTQVGISLGSNLGESVSLFHKTIVQLQELHFGDLGTFLVSSFYKTTPVDCPPGSPDFLNAVVQLESSLSSHDLMQFLQNLEKEAGRPLPRVKNIPRTLDLDLLYHGTILLTTDQLTLPHPKIIEREFVLQPLSEINPNLILPRWEKTVKKYLSDLQNNIN